MVALGERSREERRLKREIRDDVGKVVWFVRGKARMKRLLDLKLWDSICLGWTVR